MFTITRSYTPHHRDGTEHLRPTAMNRKMNEGERKLWRLAFFRVGEEAEETDGERKMGPIGYIFSGGAPCEAFPSWFLSALNLAEGTRKVKSMFLLIKCVPL